VQCSFIRKYPGASSGVVLQPPSSTSHTGSFDCCTSLQHRCQTALCASGLYSLTQQYSCPATAMMQCCHTTMTVQQRLGIMHQITICLGAGPTQAACITSTLHSWTTARCSCKQQGGYWLRSKARCVRSQSWGRPTRPTGPAASGQQGLQAACLLARLPARLPVAPPCQADVSTQACQWPLPASAHVTLWEPLLTAALPAAAPPPQQGRSRSCQQLRRCSLCSCPGRSSY
jgi:hypothetical protein